MSHNLVITNSRESEYVEFDVNIPDGYNKFRVEYLNGSIINQNYLKVGDTLKFTFANHPLRYKIPKMKVKMQYNDAEVDDTTDYTFIDMDMYKYQKLVYLPIYQYLNPITEAVNYIINPCDESMLYDEPINNVPSVVINKGDPSDPSTFSYIDFSGYYAMGLVDISSNNIPDLTITIGESISNSRTRPQDMGAFQISNNVVNEVDVNTLTINTYNYGSVWHYPVANQVLKHTESVVTHTTEYIPESRFIIGYKKESDSDHIHTYPRLQIEHNAIIDKDTPYAGAVMATSISPDGKQSEVQGVMYRYDGSNTPTPPSDTLQLLNDSIDTSTWYDTYPIIVQKTSSNPDVYHNIIGSGNEPSKSVKGSDMVTEGIIEVSGRTHRQDATKTLIDLSNATYKYIHPDWYYDVTFIKIRTVIRGSGEDDDATPIGITIRSNFIPANTIKVWHVYRSSSQTIDGYSVGFQVFYNEHWHTNGSGPYEYIYLCNSLHTDNVTGEATIAFRLITNLTPMLTVNAADPVDGHAPASILQYADDSCTNNEDIYVQAVDDPVDGHGLKISTNPMHNVLHEVTIATNIDDSTKADHPYIYSVKNYECKWYVNNYRTPDANDMPLACFIPLKTSRFLHKLTDYVSAANVSECRGWFTINDLQGFKSSYISNKSCEVYIADGHDTLNVEPASDDDAKFKTFNGTLIFDRSNTKITRLFSNDLTGACLGYINDLIAAKMSRVYYACNYKVWNAFLNTKDTLSLTRDVGFLNGIYNKYTLFTGAHETYLTSCSDIVKLIGSENVVNNCMPSLYPEEQQLFCTVTYNNQYKDSGFNIPISTTLYYKFMHYYTSGLLDYPYIGIGTNDDVNGYTTVGGVNLIYSPLGDILSTKYQAFSNNVNNRITQKPIYIVQRTGASTHKQGIYRRMNDREYFYTNMFVDNYRAIETLPAFRIYRNSNFEQTDLTITTGGLRLLHPIYMQSTPKILTHNILYMFDTVVNNLLSRYDSVMSSDGSTGFLTVLMYNNDDHHPTLTDPSHNTHRYTLLRYGTVTRDTNGGRRYVATSLDSMFLLNYLHVESVNLYQNTSELVSSLPSSPATNEEHIANLITNSIESNVQLFSSKYFNFISNVSQFAMVIFTSSYVEQVPYNKEMLKNYWWFGNDTTFNNQQLTDIAERVTSYINDTASYNNIKSCKVFICKLGEFLDFPRILYAGCESFNNSMNVSVWNYNMTKYKAPIEVQAMKDGDGRFTNYIQSLKDRSDQKVNTYLYGVMFRYHQLSHGYQNFPNELTNEYLISKALGNRTFKLILYDEYGRRIPNTDTNQGFDNNLYLELALE